MYITLNPLTWLYRNRLIAVGLVVHPGPSYCRVFRGPFSHHSGDRFMGAGLGYPQLVLAMVPFSDRLYYSGSKKTRTWPVRSGFVPNGSLN